MKISLNYYYFYLILGMFLLEKTYLSESDRVDLNDIYYYVKEAIHHASNYINDKVVLCLSKKGTKEINFCRKEKERLEEALMKNTDFFDFFFGPSDKQQRERSKFEETMKEKK